MRTQQEEAVEVMRTEKRKKQQSTRGRRWKNGTVGDNWRSNWSADLCDQEQNITSTIWARTKSGYSDMWDL